MALEDLTGTKYLDALVATNPVDGDDRPEGDDHLRGVKNVLKNTFAAITAACNATETELNLLDEAVFGGFETGDAMFFYQAAAPTGWTRDTTTSNMDGAGMRIETGVGGIAIAGTHDLGSSPSQAHTHTDTFSLDSTALTEANMASHYHFALVSGDDNDSSPIISSTRSIYETNSGGTTNYKYDFYGTTTSVNDHSKTSTVGSGTAHGHSISGAPLTNGPTAFSPKYINVIRAVKD